MSEQKITYLTDVSLLTIVVQSGLEETILKAARDIGATTATISYKAKGVGARERLGILGIAIEAEKDVISLFVSTEQLEVVLDYLFRAAGLDTPGRGYIYITPLEKVAVYVPDSVKATLEEKKKT